MENKFTLAKLTQQAYQSNIRMRIFNGETVENKNFDDLDKAVNFLISKGFTIKSESFDGDMYSYWFEKKED